jgi:hypothetical protein
MHVDQCTIFCDCKQPDIEGDSLQEFADRCRMLRQKTVTFSPDPQIQNIHVMDAEQRLLAVFIQSVRPSQVNKFASCYSRSSVRQYRLQPQFVTLKPKTNPKGLFCSEHSRDENWKKAAEARQK